MKKYKDSIKTMLGSLLGEKGDKIFEANFPRQTKEEIKAEKDRERILQILDIAQYNPHRVTDKMIKDAWRISGIRLTKIKKKKK